MTTTMQVALVTGAAGALGSAVARVLAQRGDRVALVDHAEHGQRLQQVAASVGAALFVTADVADRSSWATVIERVRTEVGTAPSRVALVAGGWRGGLPLHEEPSDANWRIMMTTNLETVYQGLRAVLGPMIEAKRGSVVVVGSRAADQPSTSAGAAAYAASKAAAVALARAVAAEVLEHGVRVNAVLPSTMDTPANRAAMPGADPSRWVSTASAAGVIAFLLSDEARDISGAALPIYGRS